MAVMMKLSKKVNRPTALITYSASDTRKHNYIQFLNGYYYAPNTLKYY